MLLPLAAIIVVALAGVQVRADTCPTSFLVHPNGNKDYCLTIDEVHTPNSRAYVRRCAAPPAFGQVWYFMPFPRNAGYFLRNLIAGTNNLCLNAEVCESLRSIRIRGRLLRRAGKPSRPGTDDADALPQTASSHRTTDGSSRSRRATTTARTTGSRTVATRSSSARSSTGAVRTSSPPFLSPEVRS